MIDPTSRCRFHLGRSHSANCLEAWLGPLKSGILDAVVAVKGQALDRGTWQVSGLVRFDEGVLRMERMGDPIRDSSSE